MVSVLLVLLFVFMFVVVAGILFLLIRQWKIPVVVLKFQGDKRRPSLFFTKGRKNVKAGMTRLYVKGYKFPVRDFNSENYYPSVKGKLGALILFEPKPGILTPLLPYRDSKNYPESVVSAFANLEKELKLHNLVDVSFDFDQKIYDSILLKIIDDTDIDFLLQEYVRVDSQYTTGWQEFLSKYGGHMALVFIGILMFAGFVLWLQKSPDLAAQCYAQVQEVSKNALVEYGSKIVGGAPPT